MANSEPLNYVVIGCSFGHPAEIIHVIAEEVTTITAMVTECKWVLYLLRQDVLLVFIFTKKILYISSLIIYE